MLTILQAATETGAPASLSISEWIALVLGAITALGAIAGLAKKVWTLKNVARASARAIEAFKKSMEEAGTPDVAKALTNGIGAELAEAAPAVRKALAAEVASAGANLVAILGPAIAKLARAPREGDGA